MRIVILLIAICLLAAGCIQKADKQAEKTTDTTAVSETTDDPAQTAENLIGRFSNSLKRELMAAIKEGGPANAINVCQEKAPEIAESFSKDNWTIRRVSEKNRNPQNVASEQELAILARFADTSGTAVKYLGEWSETEGVMKYRYYKPIRVGALCLKCHGPLDKMDDAVKQALAEKYPDDNATGYRAGELRGRFVVEKR